MPHLHFQLGGVLRRTSKNPQNVSFLKKIVYLRHEKYGPVFVYSSTMQSREKNTKMTQNRKKATRPDFAVVASGKEHNIR